MFFSIELQNDRTQNYVEAMDKAISTMTPQLIFVVLFKQVADKYSAVKKKSLVDRAGKFGNISLKYYKTYYFNYYWDCSSSL